MARNLVLVAAVLLTFATPAPAKIARFPAPLGLKMGISVEEGAAALQRAGAVKVAIENKRSTPPGGREPVVIRVNGRFAAGAAYKKVRLFFFGGALAHIVLEGAGVDAKLGSELGPPDQKSAKVRVWSEPARHQAIRCDERECALADYAQRVTKGTPEEQAKAKKELRGLTTVDPDRK